jgi:N-acetylglucosaminyldiphosphoundecaprenol N-acetyl-beta-D-mannosaminyltransferase
MTQSSIASRIDMLGVNIDAQSFDHAVNTLATWATDSTGRRYICTCPVYTLMACVENQAIRAAVNGADMVTADGMPIVWMQRRWGQPNAERVYGPDVMVELSKVTAGKGIRHYCFGGAQGIPEKLAASLQTRFSGLEVVGTDSPPIAPLGNAPEPEVVDRLNQANAHIIWVGLGSPKQDLWMQMYRPVLNAPLLIGVGAAFDFLSGAKQQAPRWMQRSGLEWLFRLAQEPRRLAKRYLIYNPKFVWYILRESFRRSTSLKSD